MKKGLFVGALAALGVGFLWWALAVGTLLVPVCNGVPILARSFRCLQPVVYGVASAVFFAFAIGLALRWSLLPRKRPRDRDRAPRTR
jgi:hypothetical protein